MDKSLVRITYIRSREVFTNTLFYLTRLIRLFSRTHTYEYIVETVKLLMLIFIALNVILYVAYIMEVMEAWSW